MTTDTRPWNIESSYYVAPRSQVRTQFDGKDFNSRIPQVRGWGRQALNILGWALLIDAIVLCLWRW